MNALSLVVNKQQVIVNERQALCPGAIVRTNAYLMIWGEWRQRFHPTLLAFFLIKKAANLPTAGGSRQMQLRIPSFSERKARYVTFFVLKGFLPPSRLRRDRQGQLRHRNRLGFPCYRQARLLLSFHKQEGGFQTSSFFPPQPIHTIHHCPKLVIVSFPDMSF